MVFHGCTTANIYILYLMYFLLELLVLDIYSLNLLKEVVKYRRNQGLQIIMYLDDGLGGASDFDSAEKDSFYIKNSLSKIGFLIAEEKCMWLPEENLTLIGLVWDIECGKLRKTDERIGRLLSLIDKTLTFVGKGRILFRSRFVACIIGHIISCRLC